MTQRHLFLGCDNGIQPDLDITPWQVYLRKQNLRPSGVLGPEPAPAGAVALARVLGIPLVPTPALAPPEGTTPAAYLQALARWGRVLEEHLSDPATPLAVVASAPVLEGLFRICFGLPLATDLTLALEPGGFLHLVYEEERDRWSLWALYNPW